MAERTRFGKIDNAPRATFKTKLEAQYAAFLYALRVTGEVRDYRYEALTLRLGRDCRFTPDFMVMAPDDVIECHEVKGPHAWEDAIVKLRTAAEMYPFRFYLCRHSKNGWERIRM